MTVDVVSLLDIMSVYSGSIPRGLFILSEGVGELKMDNQFIYEN